MYASLSFSLTQALSVKGPEHRPFDKGITGYAWGA